MYPDYKLDSPSSMSCTDVVFCNKALLSVCREELLVVAISQLVWEFQWDPFGQDFN